MDELTAVRKDALPLREASDLDPLLERIGDARYVLIGEASHGTHDYYAWRAMLSRRLIAEKGFSFVAVEGDWPDCYAVHESVAGAPDAPADPHDALHAFHRWPTWMWANTDVVDFTRWLRGYNLDLPEGDRVGFYGLDVYSLWDSLRETLKYLRDHQPQHVESALRAFRCFEPYAEDPQEYAMSTGMVPSGCESEVATLLRDVQAAAATGRGGRDAQFDAEQNARSAAGAEAYYRAMMRGDGESWNVRDRHMADTLDELVEHHGPGAKAIVWEHNTHIGDARFTDMAEAGMVNVGQLVREAHADDGVVLVGFGSYEGTVVAAENWGGRTRAMSLPPARQGSYERLLHDALGEDAAALFLFDGGGSSDHGGAQQWSLQGRSHRAVGVVYEASREHRGNYVPTVLGRRYDAFLWIDKTTALSPLRGVHEEGREREAWPSGY